MTNTKFITLLPLLNYKNDIADYAVKNGYHDAIKFMVKYLVSNGADLSVDNYYPHEIALQNGHLEIVKYLENNEKNFVKEKNIF
ncbi:ankyrin family protein [Acanthamoeba polyphaga moumouvirus]|uniref:Ankyrin family protein n=1 Tax=Acanthamoeba polyphaga moumouvirus TaxID=1269028 RepID=L7RFP1_9VIRU|nr:ankyrin family protein [Acanthamoeba polyphaga moumouvirus]AGC01635.1 ankyrin family protein [Acanthamoeba polyphaga moumouvirus]